MYNLLRNYKMLWTIFSRTVEICGSFAFLCKNFLTKSLPSTELKLLSNFDNTCNKYWTIGELGESKKKNLPARKYEYIMKVGLWNIGKYV